MPTNSISILKYLRCVGGHSQKNQLRTELILQYFLQAIYYFLKEYHEKVLKKSYDGEYDDILFIYKFLHQKIYQLHSN